jgi:hypothetical protein
MNLLTVWRRKIPVYIHDARCTIQNIILGAFHWIRKGTVIGKDYRSLYRLLSYMNKDEGSEVNHCCQVFANYSASVTKLICHIFCINFVIVNFFIYKLCFVKTLLSISFVTCKLSYVPQKLARTLQHSYKTGISVLYSAQCKRTSKFRVEICLKSLLFNFACSSISKFL